MNEIWYGTEDSLRAYLETLNSINSFQHTSQGIAVRLAESDGEEPPNPVGYQVIDNVAVLSVEGGTINKPNFFTRLFGIPSYDDIKSRFIEAYEDKSVNSVLLNLDTPGGMAKGALSLSEFISTYSSNIMPVISYAESYAASAGVLYGTAASAFMMDKYAEIGSIGAVAIFGEMSEALKQEGVNIYVARSTPYKAVPTPLEPLNDKGKEVLNEAVQRSHDMFVGALSTNLQMPIEDIQKNLATGRMFTAEQATANGLAQGVTSFSRLVQTMNNLYPKRQPTKLPNL